MGGLREEQTTKEPREECGEKSGKTEEKTDEKRGETPIRPEEHLGLARLCANRFRGRGMDDGELMREATLALCAAAVRFDPERGVAFSTYAVPWVLGDLRRACERASPMHVPRTDRALLRQVSALRREEIMRTGREPTVAELAETLALPPEELSQTLAADFQMQAIRMSGKDEEPHPVEAAVDQNAGRFVDELLLKDVIARLPPPLNELARLRFWEGLTQERTAEALSLSQAQVSKLERRAKETLRAALMET